LSDSIKVTEIGIITKVVIDKSYLALETMVGTTVTSKYASEKLTALLDKCWALESTPVEIIKNTNDEILDIQTMGAHTLGFGSSNLKELQSIDETLKVKNLVYKNYNRNNTPISIDQFKRICPHLSESKSTEQRGHSFFCVPYSSLLHSHMLVGRSITIRIPRQAELYFNVMNPWLMTSLKGGCYWESNYPLWSKELEIARSRGAADSSHPLLLDIHILKYLTGNVFLVEVLIDDDNRRLRFYARLGNKNKLNPPWQGRDEYILDDIEPFVEGFWDLVVSTWEKVFPDKQIPLFCNIRTPRTNTLFPFIHVDPYSRFFKELRMLDHELFISELKNQSVVDSRYKPTITLSTKAKTVSRQNKSNFDSTSASPFLTESEIEGGLLDIFDNHWID